LAQAGQPRGHWLHAKHVEAKFMVTSWVPPGTGKPHDTAATLQHSSNGTHGTFTDGMETETCLSMQECLRKIHCLEAEAEEAAQREQDLVQQLYEARSHIITKEKEVCDLQGQLSQELAETQRLWRSLIKRDRQILSLQVSLAGSNESHAGSKESHAGSKAGTSNADKKRFVRKTAAESHSGFNSESSTLAKGIRVKSDPSLHTTVSKMACAPPNQDALFSPRLSPRLRFPVSLKPNHQPTQTSFQQMAATPPSSPRARGWRVLANCSPRVSPGPQFRVLQVAQSRAGTISGDAVAGGNQVLQNLQVRAASRPTMQAQGMQLSPRN